MNRRARAVDCLEGRVPRTRGDEPQLSWGYDCDLDAFPARAGMNRVMLSQTTSRSSVPRTRGDEPPYAHQVTALDRRSPHARG